MQGTPWGARSRSWRRMTSRGRLQRAACRRGRAACACPATPLAARVSATTPLRASTTRRALVCSRTSHASHVYLYSPVLPHERQAYRYASTHAKRGFQMGYAVLLLAWCAQVVPATWHIVNDQDAVARSPKFLVLYKRTAHRVIINHAGDMLVRPSFIETSILKAPCGERPRRMLPLCVLIRTHDPPGMHALRWRGARRRQRGEPPAGRLPALLRVGAARAVQPQALPRRHGRRRAAGGAQPDHPGARACA